MGGVEAIRRLHTSQPELRFIVLTTYDGDEDIRKALDAGAQAYLLKGMSHEDVTGAIRKVHRGLRCIPEPVSRRLADRPPHSELSPREVEVIELIAKGFSNRCDAARLNGCPDLDRTREVGYGEASGSSMAGSVHLPHTSRVEPRSVRAALAGILGWAREL